MEDDEEMDQFENKYVLVYFSKICSMVLTHATCKDNMAARLSARIGTFSVGVGVTF